MRIRKSFTVLFSLLFVLSCFAGCSDTNGDEQTTQTQVFYTEHGFSAQEEKILLTGVGECAVPSDEDMVFYANDVTTGSVSVQDSPNNLLGLYVTFTADEEFTAMCKVKLIDSNGDELSTYREDMKFDRIGENTFTALMKTPDALEGKYTVKWYMDSELACELEVDADTMSAVTQLQTTAAQTEAETTSGETSAATTAPPTSATQAAAPPTSATQAAAPQISATQAAAPPISAAQAGAAPTSAPQTAAPQTAAPATTEPVKATNASRETPYPARGADASRDGAAATYAMLDAIRSGVLTVRISGGMIDKMDLFFTNKLNVPMTVIIELGTWLDSNTATAQDMLITSKQVFTLSAGEKEHLLTVPTACMEIEKDIPDPSVTFNIRQLSNTVPLYKVLSTLGNGKYSFDVIQAAVWITTDNADVEQVGVLQLDGARLISVEEYELAVRLVETS